jgi:ferrous iron transport protein B
VPEGARAGPIDPDRAHRAQAEQTNSYVAVSNYPGTTVEIARGWTAVDGERVPVLDTPGAHSFIPASEDERVTRDILLRDGTRAAVAVGDAKNLERTLLLALQLCELEVPFVLCLNMMDEARNRRIEIDVDALADLLGVDVIPTVAIQRKGLPRVRLALERPRPGHAGVRYPEPIERALDRVVPLMPEAPISQRALALMILCGDQTLVEWLRDRVDAPVLSVVEDVRQQLRRAFRDPVLYVVNHSRLERARQLAGRVVSTPATPAHDGRAFLRWLERMTVHPVWSVPVLGGVLYLAYLFVGVFGAGMLVDLLENSLFGRWINPAATAVVERTVPWEFLADMLVGPYGVVTMALTYALALILPIVTTFFIAFGVLEDSGYLPRLAVILNRLFKRIGLNGKAVLPMILGLGCDTMATLTTRILETRKERLIVIVLLSLAVPCSAQLTVILAMLGAISLTAMGIWLAVIAGVIVLVGTLAARLVPGQSSDFIVELPPLRLPRLSNILLKTVGRIEWYLKEALPLFVLGTLVLFLGDRLGLLERVRVAVEPVISGLLGLPREAAEAFLIGFLRRDFGAAGLYEMMRAGQLDAAQVVVAAVTITLFMPCIAQFFMIVKELGWRTSLVIAVFVFGFALVVGGALNWVLGVWPVL